MPSTESHRLNILTQSEISDIYNLPQFDDEDRQYYFAMSDAEQACVGLRRPSAGIFQALELGYFKAKKQFFSFELAGVMDDLHHLARRHFTGVNVRTLSVPSKPTRLLIRQAILSLTGYRDCDASAKHDLVMRMQRTAALLIRPDEI